MVNPLDVKTVLLAKHAQHVVLIHFPIALFISAVTFDLISQWTKLQGLADTAYYNLVGAASNGFCCWRRTNTGLGGFDFYQFFEDLAGQFFVVGRDLRQ
ncbi:MAG: hypothetical protein JO187_10550 [Acidobacteria bacterium]|nr:hypothetical protein [Acidobacteriota bacterium]